MAAILANTTYGTEDRIFRKQQSKSVMLMHGAFALLLKECVKDCPLNKELTINQRTVPKTI